MRNVESRSLLRVQRATTSSWRAWLTLVLSATLALCQSSSVKPEESAGWRILSLPSMSGAAAVMTKQLSVAVPDAHGEDGSRQVLVAYSPTNRTVWMGTPDNHLVVMDDRLVGFKATSAATGGFLLVRVSTNRLAAGVSDTAGLDSAILNHLKSVNAEDMVWSRADRRISLCDYVGRSALMDLNRADIGDVPVVTATAIQGSNVVVSMKSYVGKEIVITFDELLSPLVAKVNGLIMFERGVKRPPSLADELRVAEAEQRARSRKAD